MLWCMNVACVGLGEARFDSSIIWQGRIELGRLGVYQCRVESGNVTYRDVEPARAIHII